MNKKILLFFVFLYCGYTAQASQLTVPASRFGANQVSSIVSHHWKPITAFGVGAGSSALGLWGLQSNVGLRSQNAKKYWGEIKTGLNQQYGVYNATYWKKLLGLKYAYLTAETGQIGEELLKAEKDRLKSLTKDVSVGEGEQPELEPSTPQVSEAVQEGSPVSACPAQEGGVPPLSLGSSECHQLYIQQQPDKADRSEFSSALMSHVEDVTNRLDSIARIRVLDYLKENPRLDNKNDLKLNILIQRAAWNEIERRYNEAKFFKLLGAIQESPKHFNFFDIFMSLDLLPTFRTDNLPFNDRAFSGNTEEALKFVAQALSAGSVIQAYKQFILDKLKSTNTADAILQQVEKATTIQQLDLYNPFYRSKLG